IYVVTGDGTVGLIMLTLPGYIAGLVVRLRRETAEQLAQRVRELDQERELFARVSVGNERVRIASELHDIVGHALSVMVVQAAAGRSLTVRVENDEGAAPQNGLAGGGRGLAGLRERVAALGGRFEAGPTGEGGWRVEARLHGRDVARAQHVPA